MRQVAAQTRHLSDRDVSDQYAALTEGVLVSVSPN